MFRDAHATPVGGSPLSSRSAFGTLGARSTFSAPPTTPRPRSMPLPTSGAVPPADRRVAIPIPTPPGGLFAARARPESRDRDRCSGSARPEPGRTCAVGMRTRVTCVAGRSGRDGVGLASRACMRRGGRGTRRLRPGTVEAARRVVQDHTPVEYYCRTNHDTHHCPAQRHTIRSSVHAPDGEHSPSKCNAVLCTRKTTRRV